MSCRAAWYVLYVCMIIGPEMYRDHGSAVQRLCCKEKLGFSFCSTLSVEANFNNVRLLKQEGLCWEYKQVDALFCMPTNHLLLFTARCSYASAVLVIVILSFCPSVCLPHACLVTKRNDLLPIFWYHMKGQSFYFWYQQILVSDVLLYLKFALKLTHPFEKRRLRPMSAYNVSTVRASGR